MLETHIPERNTGVMAARRQVVRRGSFHPKDRFNSENYASCKVQILAHIALPTRHNKHNTIYMTISQILEAMGNKCKISFSVVWVERLRWDTNITMETTDASPDDIVDGRKMAIMIICDRDKFIEAQDFIKNNTPNPH